MHPHDNITSIRFLKIFNDQIIGDFVHPYDTKIIKELFEIRLNDKLVKYSIRNYSKSQIIEVREKRLYNTDLLNTVLNAFHTRVVTNKYEFIRLDLL